MGKVRIGQLAKELNLRAAVLMARLKEMGGEAKSNLSSVEDDVAARVRSLVGGAGAKAPEADSTAPRKSTSPPRVDRIPPAGAAKAPGAAVQKTAAPVAPKSVTLAAQPHTAVGHPGAPQPMKPAAPPAIRPAIKPGQPAVLTLPRP